MFFEMFILSISGNLLWKLQSFHTGKRLWKVSFSPHQGNAFLNHSISARLENVYWIFHPFIYCGNCCVKILISPHQRKSFWNVQSLKTWNFTLWKINLWKGNTSAKDGEIFLCPPKQGFMFRGCPPTWRRPPRPPKKKTLTYIDCEIYSCLIRSTFSSKTLTILWLKNQCEVFVVWIPYVYIHQNEVEVFLFEATRT